MSNGDKRGRKKETAVKTAFVTPGKTSGNNGEMRLVTTKTGPKLKVKYQNKWWQMDLADPAKENIDNFVPRVWVHRGNTTNGASVSGSDINTRVYLPKYITTGNIIGLFFGPAIGAYIYTFWWMGGKHDGGTAANGGDQRYQCMVHYEELTHSIRIELNETATSMDNAGYIMSVFYKP